MIPVRNKRHSAKGRIHIATWWSFSWRTLSCVQRITQRIFGKFCSLLADNYPLSMSYILIYLRLATTMWTIHIGGVHFSISIKFPAYLFWIISFLLPRRKLSNFPLKAIQGFDISFSHQWEWEFITRVLFCAEPRGWETALPHTNISFPFLFLILETRGSLPSLEVMWFPFISLVPIRRLYTTEISAYTIQPEGGLTFSSSGLKPTPPAFKLFLESGSLLAEEKKKSELVFKQC